MAINDVDATKLIENAAIVIEKDKLVEQPAWTVFVKTGVSRQRPPMQENWWFIRSAAVLRKLALLGPVGTSKLKAKFGGKKNMGTKPERVYDGSGKVIRTILQQLEKAGLAKQVEKEVHKGRIITPKGQKLLEKVASEIMKSEGIVLPQRPKGVVLDVKEDKPKKSAKKTVAKKRVKKSSSEEKKESSVGEQKPVADDQKPTTNNQEPYTNDQ